MKYSNPTWEPYFKDLSPTLSKLYYIVATMIFKKLDWMERRAANWT